MVIICSNQKFEMNCTLIINKMVQAVDQRNYLSGKKWRCSTDDKTKREHHTQVYYMKYKRIVLRKREIKVINI